MLSLGVARALAARPDTFAEVSLLVTDEEWRRHEYRHARAVRRPRRVPVLRGRPAQRRGERGRGRQAQGRRHDADRCHPTGGALGEAPPTRAERAAGARRHRDRGVPPARPRRASGSASCRRSCAPATHSTLCRPRGSCCSTCEPTRATRLRGRAREHPGERDGVEPRPRCNECGQGSTRARPPRSPRPRQCPARGARSTGCRGAGPATPAISAAQHFADRGRARSGRWSRPTIPGSSSSRLAARTGRGGPRSGRRSARRFLAGPSALRIGTCDP